MRQTAIALLVFALAASAYAAPQADQIDETNQALPIGLMDRIDHVRHAVGDRTSELVMSALGFLGVPYRFGGNNAETGFDCSGFVRAMYDRSLGLLLPRRAEEQAAATEKIDRSELRPGDLVFFNTMRRAFSHVGIYIGDGKFIHSPHTGSHVRVESLDGSYWQRHFDGARRVVESGDAD